MHCTLEIPNPNCINQYRQNERELQAQPVLSGSKSSLMMHSSQHLLLVARSTQANITKYGKERYGNMGNARSGAVGSANYQTQSYSQYLV